MNTVMPRIINLFALTLMFFTLVSTVGCSGDKGSASKSGIGLMPAPLSKVSPSFLAPDTELMDMDGAKHKLSDFRGKPVIVNFWATWCPPCRDELPSMNRAWAKVEKEGIQMLAVNMGETEETIFPFTGDFPIDFTILLDTSGAYAIDWKVQGLPTTYVVNPDGQVVYQAVGGREWDDKVILDMVRALKNNMTDTPIIKEQ